MAKQIISATIDVTTELDIREYAKKIDRSFSKTVDILLREGLKSLGKKK